MFVSCFLIGCEDGKKANIIQDTSDIQEISATLYNEKEIKVTNIEKIKDLGKSNNLSISFIDLSVNSWILFSADFRSSSVISPSF